ncbi:hypothetical protein [Nocardia arthritidis]|uniref:ABM domain-containing protein n=1 Tax=Nocardia arthritidis TaxID=228602 RepID=A0A6G9YH46_9NOCA|nr:hypothetical protein [Nocardia arthritidis]QIS12470.1 hypothetical protein F5544_23045 [Nocardia arthritidis]
MSYLVVDQTVESIDRWIAAFSAATERRKDAGGELVMALNDPARPGRLLVIVKFDSPEHALAWRDRPGVDHEIAQVGVVPGSVTVRVLEQLPV